MPRKGISDISYSLYNLAIDLGVKFYFNSQIDSIIIKNKSAVGVSINKINHKADIIISNMDINLTYDNVKSESNILNYDYDSESFTFGISKSAKLN